MININVLSRLLFRMYDIIMKLEGFYTCQKIQRLKSRLLLAA